MPLTLRQTKGSKLTIQEMDDNLTYLEGLINDVDSRVSSAQGDISDLQNVISDIQNEWTETSITVNTAQVLNLKNNFIELLTPPGENQYYDIDAIFLEYIYKNKHFTVSEVSTMVIQQGNDFISINKNFITELNTVIKIDSHILSGLAAYIKTNQSIKFGTTGGSPKDGEGSIRIIVRYKKRTVNA